MKKIIDVSLPISPAMVIWPGAPRTEFAWRRSMQRGDKSNNSNFAMNSHTGTHVDAPLHFVNHGRSVEKIELSHLVGEAFLIDLSTEETISTEGLQKNWPSKKADRLLIKTKNSKIWETNQTDFVENFIALREQETKWLLDKNIKTVGIDYLSIQCYGDSPVVHQLLLEKDVAVIEGLDLREVKQGWYELVCLPLKLEGLEGAPARCILKTYE